MRQLFLPTFKAEKGLGETPIPIDHTVLLQGKEPIGYGAFGTFYAPQDKKERGVKIYHEVFEEVWEALESDTFYSAKREFKNLLEAYPSGITPKPYKVGITRYNGYWRVFLEMQYIRGEHPDDPDLDEAIEKLERLGIFHSDLHCGNIIKDTKGKLWVIDLGTNTRSDFNTGITIKG